MKLKAASGMMLTLLLIGILTLAFNIQPAKSEPTTIIVPDDYPTIQGGINAASDGDTIFVRAGTRYEHVIINKSISLIGENRNTTVIDGNGTGNVIDITAHQVNVTGFTVQNGTNGIFVNESKYNTLSGNIVTDNQNGIQLFTTCLCRPASNNTIRNNTIKNNIRGIHLTISPDNVIYHNNFLNNTHQVYSYPYAHLPNVWDDDYPSGGNYWSDYTGVDVKSGPNQDQLGSDTIGDTPYVINSNNRDNYPLMTPWPSGPGFHNLEVTLKAPTRLPPENSTILEATVNNKGFNNEENVTFFLFVNNTIVNYTTIALLEADSSYTINYLWTPTIEGRVNVTAYATPVLEEIYVANNRKTVLVVVSSLPPVQNTNTGLYYDTIQEAIDAPETFGCHTIKVDVGTYYEHLTIDKSLKIMGENRTYTIIDGNKTGTFVVRITANNVVLSGFTIQNSNSAPTPAIRLDSSNNVISNNTIINNGRGIYAFSVSNNTIQNNIITNNVYGIYLEWATTHTVKNNTIANHQQAGTYLLISNSSNNKLYHNNFIKKASLGLAVNSDNNVWDDGYPSGGNYWSDYAGDDLYSGPYQNETGSDGIGDTPYTFSWSNQDRYPLMNPLGSPQPPIANFVYTPEHPVIGETVTFNASSSYDRDGSIASYEWNFGDGNVTTVTTPTINHTYTTEANYSVTLTITDAQGLQSNKTQTVIVSEVPPLVGDVNGDGLVDMRDVGIACSAYGCSPGDPMWDPRADVNRDDVVDMRDIGIMCGRYGLSGC